jgi:hypothetical protein
MSREAQTPDGQNMETARGAGSYPRCRVASSPLVRYHFVGIEGTHAVAERRGRTYGVGTYPSLHHWDRGPVIAFAQ